MSRRKGEITSRMNERDFPHIVELPLPEYGFRSKSADIVTFHSERGVPIRHGRSRRDDDKFLVRYCFPRFELADVFRDQFGGERLTADLQSPGSEVICTLPAPCKAGVSSIVQAL
jgi:hypothetical protein